KHSPHESVRQLCSMALSDFGYFPSQLWGKTGADPRLDPVGRAAIVETALKNLQYWETQEYPATFGYPDNIRGDRLAWAITDCYKMPPGMRTITAADDPGLRRLEQVLDSRYPAARFAAAKVLAESALGFDHLTRKKACEVLVGSILDPNLGPRAKREA